MKTMYKYPLEIKTHQKVRLPRSAKVTCVKVVGGKLCAYAFVDTDETEFVYDHIYIYGTGHEIRKEHLGFIDTCLMPNGEVWHVFVDIDPEL